MGKRQENHADATATASNVPFREHNIALEWTSDSTPL